MEKESVEEAFKRVIHDHMGEDYSEEEATASSIFSKSPQELSNLIRFYKDELDQGPKDLKKLVMTMFKDELLMELLGSRHATWLFEILDSNDMLQEGNSDTFVLAHKNICAFFATNYADQKAVDSGLAKLVNEQLILIIGEEDEGMLKEFMAVVKGHKLYPDMVKELTAPKEMGEMTDLPLKMGEMTALPEEKGEVTDIADEDTSPKGVELSILEFEDYTNMNQDLLLMPKGSIFYNLQLALVQAFERKYLQQLEDKKVLITRQDGPVSYKDLEAQIKGFGMFSTELEKYFKNLIENPKEDLNGLIAIKQSLFIINTLELARLIKKTDEAKKNIKGKKIIFVMGCTGAGKTTSILKLLGYNLVRKKVKEIDTYAPEGKLAEQHQQLVTSPEAKSCTRYIFAAKIPEKYFEDDDVQEIWIVDSPGFGDLAGVEVDIANGIGMITALYGCSQVWPVILLTFASFVEEKGQPFKNLMKIISELIVDYRTVKDSLNFVFNKVEDKDRDNMEPRCRSIVECMIPSEKGDEKFSNLLKKVLSITTKKKLINIMNPILSDANTMVTNFTKNPPIGNPEDNFKYSFTDKTKLLIRGKGQDCERLIYKFYKEGLYAEVNYCLTDLKTFASIVMNNEVSDIYAGVIKQLNKTCRVPFNNYDAYVKEDVMRRGLDQQIVNRMKIAHKDVEAMAQLKHHLDIPDQRSFDLLKEETRTQVESIIKEGGKLENKILNFQMYAENFDSELTARIKQLLKAKLTEMERNLVEEIGSWDLENLKPCYHEFLDAASNYSALFKQEAESEFLKWQAKGEQKMEHLIEATSNSYNAIMNTIEVPLDAMLKSETMPRKDTKIEQSSIKDIEKALQKLGRIEKADIKLREELMNPGKKALQRIVTFAKDLIKTLDSITSSAEEECESDDSRNMPQANTQQFKELNSLVFNSMQLIKIEKVDEAIGFEIRNSVHRLRYFVEKQQGTLRTMIQGLKNKDLAVAENHLKDIQSIFRNLRELSRTGRDQQMEQQSEELIHETLDEIKTYLADLKGEVARINNSLNVCGESKVNSLIQKYRSAAIFKKISSSRRKEEQKSLNQAEMGEGDKGDPVDQIKKLTGLIIKTIHESLLLPYHEAAKVLKESEDPDRFMRNCVGKVEKYVEYLRVIGKQRYALADMIDVAILDDEETKLKDQLRKVFKKLEGILENTCENLMKEEGDLTEQIPEKQSLVTMRTNIKFLYNLNSKDLAKYLAEENLFSVSEQLDRVRGSLEDKIQHLQTMIEHAEVIIETANEFPKLFKVFEFLSVIAESINFERLPELKENGVYIKKMSAGFFDDISTRIKQSITPSNIDFDELKNIALILKNDQTAVGKTNKTKMQNLIEKVIKDINKRLKVNNSELAFTDLSSNSIEEFCSDLERLSELEEELLPIFGQKEFKFSFDKKIIKQCTETISTLFADEYNNLVGLINSYEHNIIETKLLQFRKIELKICKVQVFREGEYKKMKGHLNTGVDHNTLYKEMNYYLKKKKNDATGFFKGKTTEEFEIRDGIAAVHASREGDERKEIERLITDKMNAEIENFMNQYSATDTISLNKIEDSVQKKINLLPHEIKRVILERFADKKKEMKNLEIKAIEQLKSETNVASIPQVLSEVEKSIVTKRNQPELTKVLQTSLERADKNITNMSLMELTTHLRDVYCTSIMQKPEFKKIFLNESKETARFRQAYVGNEERVIRIITEKLQAGIGSTLRQLDGVKQESRYRPFSEDVVTNLEDLFSAQHILISEREQIVSKNKQKMINLLLHFSTQAVQKYAQCNNEFDPNCVYGDLQEYKKMSNVLLEGSAITKVFEVIKRGFGVISTHYSEPNFVSTFDTINSAPDFNVKKDEFMVGLESIKQELTNYEFYNSDRRNWSGEQFDQEFEAIQAKVKKMEIFEKRCNSALIKDESKQINTQQIRASLQKKFNDETEDALEQVKLGFNDADTDINEKVNTVHDMFRALTKKHFGFIEVDGRAKRNFEEVIEKNYEKKDLELGNDVESLRVWKETTLKDIKSISDNNKARELIDVKTNHEEMMTKSIDAAKEKHQKGIEVEADESKKKELEKVRDTEIDGYKNSSKSDINEEQNKIRERYKIEDAKLNEETTLKIKEIALKMAVMKKALTQIKVAETTYNIKLKMHINSLAYFGKKKIINELAGQLENNIYAKMILSDDPNFKGHQSDEFNKLVSRTRSPEYVLGQIRPKLSQQVIQKLLRVYELYKCTYMKWKNAYAASHTEDTIDQLLNSILDSSSKLSKFYMHEDNNPLVKGCNLLAEIFAMWTILQSEIDDEEDKVIYYYDPHEAQVITIFLLLGFVKDGDKSILKNTMAQVGTGEGKSYVLAGLSCFLSLVGFDVKCACYSSYLSSRDQNAFMKLYTKLGIANKIKYGIFNELCEDILNTEKDQTFSESLVEMMLISPGLWDKRKTNIGKQGFSFKKCKDQVPKILLIDQVDVFFDKAYFGSSYLPTTSIDGEAVSNLIKFIWGLRTDTKLLTKTFIMKSSEFDQVVNNYPTLKTIMGNQVGGMITGLKNYNHQYLIVGQKLVYKDNDGISDSMHFGYKTVFANCYEYFEKSTISQENFSKAMDLSLIIAQFSYAMLPSYFEAILGVTGTLQVMPKFKKEYLTSKYDVAKENQYIIPSVYGSEIRRHISQKVALRADYEKELTAHIDEIHKTTRPVIVLFKTNKEIVSFFNCDHYQKLKGQTMILTEEHDSQTRDNRIKRASFKNKITFMTSSFGRGTDFVIYDKQIEKLGGIHVVQAYLSLEESEEIQVRGRTARQGKQGSYQLLISENELQLLNLTYSPTMNISESFKVQRDRMCEGQAEEIKKMLASADSKHQETISLFESSKLSQDQLLSKIYEFNQQPEPPITKSVRTILALDATCSMTLALAKTLTILEQTFGSIYQVLREKKVNGSIEMQMVVYRNYNSDKDDILVVSPFEGKPEGIRQFLKNIDVSGGWGNEAIEVCYEHISKQDAVDQVILIGDAAANTVGETKARRNHKGETYWNSNGFKPTTAYDELQKLAAKNIPIHTFYLGAEKYFTQVSRQTNGLSQKFQIHSPNASEKLTDFIVERILELVGGGGADGANLVKAYQEIVQKKRFKTGKK